MQPETQVNRRRRLRAKPIDEHGQNVADTTVLNNTESDVACNTSFQAEEGSYGSGDEQEIMREPRRRIRTASTAAKEQLPDDIEETENAKHFLLFSADGITYIVDGKHSYKGNLLIYNDELIFSGKIRVSKQYHICNVEASLKTFSIPRWFSTKTKQVLKVKISENDSLLFEMEPHLYEEALQVVNEASQKAIQKRYFELSQKMDSVSSSDEAMGLADEFKHISSYLDSKLKSEKCISLARELKNNETNKKAVQYREYENLNGPARFAAIRRNLAAEEKRKAEERIRKEIENCEKTYKEAVAYSISDNVEDIYKAIALFRTISDYRDVPQKLDAAKQKKLAKEREEKKRREEEERRQKEEQEKKRTYKDAVKFSDSDDLEDIYTAISLFMKIPDYLDVPERFAKVKLKQITREREIKEEEEKRRAEEERKRKEKIYNRAIEYCDRETSSELDEAISLLNEIRDSYDVSQLLAEVKQKREECLQKEEAERARIYKLALGYCDRETISELDEAISLLNTISEYRDVSQKLAEIKQKIDRIRKEEEERKRIYKQAFKYFDRETISELDEAIILLNRIPDYLDASQRLEEVKQKKERIRKEEEERAKIYNQALEYCDRETSSELDEAISLFNKIPDYLDVSQKLAEVKQKKERIRKEEEEREKIYNLALEYSDRETSSELDEAISLFNKIPDYLDVSQRLDEVKQKKERIRKEEEERKQTYNLALEYSDRETSSELDEAISLFNKIPDYLDVSQRLDEVKQKKERIRKEEEEREQTYNLALEYCDKETSSELDEAISLFNKIPDYLDVSQRLDEVKQKKERIRREEAERERIYKQALKYCEGETISELDEAISLFNKIPDYLDVSQKLAEAKQKKECIKREEAEKERTYKLALNYSNSEKIEELNIALSLLNKIPDYLDVSKRLAEVKQKKGRIQREEAERKRTYKKALEYCEGETTSELDEAISLLNKIPDYLDASKRLAEVKQKKERIRKEEEEREKTYKLALEYCERETIDDLGKAISLLNKIPDYLDASQRLAEVKQKRERIQREEAEAERERTYKLALEYCERETTGELDEAINLLNKIPDYRDVSQKLAEVKQKKERIRREEEEAEKERIYKQALEYSGSEMISELDVAINLLNTIPEYLDASQKLAEVKRKREVLIEEEEKCKQTYYEAVWYSSRETIGELDEAINLLNKIPDYRDVSQRLAEVRQKKERIQREKAKAEAERERTYKLALEYCERETTGELDEAISLLNQIPDYLDAAQRLAEVKQKIKTIKRKETEKKKKIYKLALEYGSGETISELDEAISLLNQIPDFLDVSKKLAEVTQKRDDLIKKEQREKEIETKIQQEIKVRDDTEATKQKISLANRKALNVFLDNPFRVFGLSRDASADEARAVMDKFKKLERLKALNSYTVLYHLKHFEKPNRSASVIQASISTLDDVNNRILWFKTSAGCMAWNSKEYRCLDCELPSVEYDSYDVFLANYLYAILNDASFSDVKLWKNVFEKMTCFIKEGQNLTSIFSGAEKEQDFCTLFEKRISQPVVYMIEEANITQLKNLYVITSENDNLKTISKELDRHLSDWFNSETGTIDKALAELGDGEKATTVQIDKAKQLVYDLNNTVWPELNWAEHNYPKKSVRLTMFKDQYAQTAWSLMVFLFQAGEKANAKKIADEIEKYCTDEQKDLIKYVIREIPRPKPKPVPPEHDHYDLGYVFISYNEIKIVEVTLHYSANV